MLKNSHVLIGITGGIAAYKIPALVSMLTKAGAEVKVMMTQAACEFITPLTLQTMSGHEVHVDMFNQLMNMNVEHIALAKWAEVILLAPATANTIAKYTAGICDNLLTTVLQAARCPVVIAPAMNTYMFNSPANQANLRTLQERGCTMLQPLTDRLACNEVGIGKMPEPASLFEAIITALAPKDLLGLRFVITAGATIEPIDPVRYISNYSTGKMGKALAVAAKRRGAEVSLIYGPAVEDLPNLDEMVPVKTTRDMFAAVTARFPQCDVLIKAAAPADYRPSECAAEKIKKNGKEEWHEIPLTPNPDIAAYCGSIKQNQILVGFAAESINEMEYGLAKLRRKNLDLICVNNIKQAGAGFRTDTNIVTLIDRKGREEKFPLMEKTELADIILDRVAAMRAENKRR